MTAPPLPREQFPVADRFRYLDHAGIAAPPTVVAHAVAREAAAATMLGSTAARRDDRIEDVRSTCAALMGVPTDDVTFVKSSADGLRLVAFGQPWARGDRVILSDSEHPATAHPWMALARVGVDVTAVPAVGDAWSLPLEAFEAALIEGAGRVRAVVVSWIHYARGWRTDLAALADLAHQHGAILVADVVQASGSSRPSSPTGGWTPRWPTGTTTCSDLKGWACSTSRRPCARRCGHRRLRNRPRCRP